MNPNYLDFEQPIAELAVKIEELRLVGSDNAINIGSEIENLRDKSTKLTEKIYSNLSSWDIVKVARHPQRPYTLDYIPRIFTEFDDLLSLIHISEPTRPERISFAVFCLKKQIYATHLLFLYPLLYLIMLTLP